MIPFESMSEPVLTFYPDRPRLGPELKPRRPTVGLTGCQVPSASTPMGVITTESQRAIPQRPDSTSGLHYGEPALRPDDRSADFTG